MPSNHESNRAGSAADAAVDRPKAGETRKLLRALHEDRVPPHARLYDEICRINPGKEHDPSELIECSIKLSPRGFSRQRHGGSVSWQPSDRSQLADSACKAAPNDAVQRALERPPTTGESPSPATPPSAKDPQLEALQKWAERGARFFSAIAYDFDAKVYKLYQFKHRPVAYFEELDLIQRQAELPSLAYIRSAEVPMDDPQKWSEALYFKLRFLTLAAAGTTTPSPSIVVPRQPSEILAADFRPHPLLSPGLLSALSKRAAVVDALGLLLKDLPVVNEPVVKLTPPVLDPAATPDQIRKAWADLAYGVSINLLDSAKIRFVEDHEALLLKIADAMGCEAQAKDWLKQIQPFDCFYSYLGLGPDSVTLYYRSTTLHRRRPAPHYRRGGTPLRDGTPPRDS